MTNAEKFKEVFGFKSNTNEPPVYPCPDGKNITCKYVEIDENGFEFCRCEKWWDEEYKGKE